MIALYVARHPDFFVFNKSLEWLLAQTIPALHPSVFWVGVAFLDR